MSGLAMSRPPLMRAGSRVTPVAGTSAPASPDRLASLLLALGLPLALAGWLDIALFWYPPRFGVAEWEFGIITQTLDALPLPTLGSVLVVGALVLRGVRAVWLRLAAAGFGLVALALLGCAAIYALDLPHVLRALQRPELTSMVKRAVVKSVLLHASYLATYVTIAALMWRMPLRSRRDVAGGLS